MLKEGIYASYIIYLECISKSAYICDFISKLVLDSDLYIAAQNFSNLYHCWSLAFTLHLVWFSGHCTETIHTYKDLMHPQEYRDDKPVSVHLHVAFDQFHTYRIIICCLQNSDACVLLLHVTQLANLKNTLY